VKTKPNGTETLSEEAAKAQSGEVPNPIFVCLAGAGYETCRALRLFMGESSEESQKQFSELPKVDRDEMVDDAMQVVSGAKPPDLHQKYARRTGAQWSSLDPVERVLWTTFCAAVNLQFEAVKHLAAATNPQPQGGDNDG